MEKERIVMIAGELKIQWQKSQKPVPNKLILIINPNHYHISLPKIAVRCPSLYPSSSSTSSRWSKQATMKKKQSESRREDNRIRQGTSKYTWKNPFHHSSFNLKTIKNTASWSNNSQLSYILYRKRVFLLVVRRHEP